MLLLPLLLLPALVLSSFPLTPERPCPPALLALSSQLLCLSSNPFLHIGRCGCGMRRLQEAQDTKTKNKTNKKTKIKTKNKTNTNPSPSSSFSRFLKMNRGKRGPRCMISCLRHGMLHPAQCHALC